MARDSEAEDDYVHAGSKEEENRLARVGETYSLITRQFLEAAGVAAGMRVLELGSGSGAVAIAAAQLVGTGGSVVGVDINPEILATARARARAAGLGNVSFVAADIREAMDLGDDFDALIGRSRLANVGRPVEVLRQAATHVRPGGLIAFQETSGAAPWVVYPSCPLVERVAGWIQRALTASPFDMWMGHKLYRTFLDAGLPEPQMRAQSNAATGSDSAFTDLLAIQVRSFLPSLESSGVTTAEEADVDSLAERLRKELVANRAVLTPPPFIEAWARKPQSTDKSTP